MRETGVTIIFFFSIPWLLIEGLMFIVGAITCKPVEMGKTAYTSVITWTNNYTGIVLVIMAVICIIISLLLGETIPEKIIYIPSMFLGFWLIYNLIIYGMTDLFSGLEGIWLIFAIFFALIWIVLVFIFIIITIVGTVLPICVANNVKNNISRYFIKGTLSLAVSGVALWLNFMFSTEFWHPAGQIFISLFGER